MVEEKSSISVIVKMELLVSETSVTEHQLLWSKQRAVFFRLCWPGFHLAGRCLIQQGFYVLNRATTPFRFEIKKFPKAQFSLN